MNSLIKWLTIVVCVVTVFAEEDSPAKRKKLAPSEPVVVETDGAPRAGETLSTKTSGLDSLGVMPTEMETQANGGTRRVKLESLVFNRHEPVQYLASDLRDPFRALVEKDKPDDAPSDLLSLDGAVLTGVVWSDGKYLAMVKDKDAKSFFLREGDAVQNGKVLYVGQTESVFEVTEFGDYSRITLQVQG